MVSFLDEVDEDGIGSYLPRPDTSFVGQGLMIDVKSFSCLKLWGAVLGLRATVVWRVWTQTLVLRTLSGLRFLKEAEGIEMFF